MPSQQPQARAWCFTLNETFDFILGERDLEFYENLISGVDIRYAVWQLEQGTCVHIQGYISFSKKKRMSSIKSEYFVGMEHVHLEIARGSEEDNFIYCTKQDETFLCGPWQKGTRSYQNSLSRLKEAVDEGIKKKQLWSEYFNLMIRHDRAIDRYILSQSDPRNWKTELHVIYGAAGSGKSKTAAEEAGPRAYWKPTGEWFDGYEGHENVVIDDFKGEIARNEFWKITDRYPHNAKVKFGHVNWAPRKIWVTSLYSPAQWWKEMTQEDEIATYRRITTIREIRPNTLCTLVIDQMPAVRTFLRKNLVVV